MKKLVVVLSLLLLGADVARAEDDPALCMADETILFSCAVGKKVASVCASRDLSLSSGVLTYRFGSRKESPELTYPTNRKAVGDAFSYAFSGYAKGSSQELAFEVGAYRYTVYVEKHVFDDSASGVVVEKDAKLVANLKCNKAFRENENLYSLKALGMPVGMPRGIGVSET